MRSKLLIGGLGAAVAFLLATSPVVAQAAGFITSGDIVNNTIKSKDVKDHNLKGKDLAANTITGTEVNEATLAGVNASTLNGLAPSAYQNPAYRFRLSSAGAASTTKTFTFAVPAGSYLVTYDVITNAEPVACYIQSTSSTFPGEAFQYGTDGGSFATTSSSGVLTVAAGQTPQMTCFGASYTIYPNADVTSSVVFTKIDGFTALNAGGSRSTEDSRPGGGALR